MAHTESAPPTKAAKSEDTTAALQDEVAVLRQKLAMRPSDSDSTYRAVFDSVNDAILLNDFKTGVIVDVNQCTVETWGYRREELLGNPIAMLGSVASARELLHDAPTWRRVVAGEACSFEWVGRHKSGRTGIFEVLLKRARLAGTDRVLAVMRDIAERKERDCLREELIRSQAEMLAELSTPLVPITDHVVIMPLIGLIDAPRANRILETLLHGVSERRARVAILDITGVPVMDAQAADALVRIAGAVRLLGTRLVLTGIRPEIAQVLAGLDVDLKDITTFGTLQAGIASTLRDR